MKVGGGVGNVKLLLCAETVHIFWFVNRSLQNSANYGALLEPVGKLLLQHACSFPGVQNITRLDCFEVASFRCQFRGFL